MTIGGQACKWIATLARGDGGSVVSRAACGSIRRRSMYRTLRELLIVRAVDELTASGRRRVIVSEFDFRDHEGWEHVAFRWED